MAWPPQTTAGYGRLRGFTVFCSDNEKLGIVERVMHPDTPDFGQARGNYVFIINTGRLARWFGVSVLGHQLYVPESAIQTVGDDHLILDIPLSRLHEQEWTQMPAGEYTIS